MDENIRYNIKSVKNNIDLAKNQMIYALNLLKTDININGTALENNRINSSISSMRDISITLSNLIR